MAVEEDSLELGHMAVEEDNPGEDTGPSKDRHVQEELLVAVDTT